MGNLGLKWSGCTVLLFGSDEGCTLRTLEDVLQEDYPGGGRVDRVSAPVESSGEPGYKRNAFTGVSKVPGRPD